MVESLAKIRSILVELIEFIVMIYVYHGMECRQAGSAKACNSE